MPALHEAPAPGAQNEDSDPGHTETPPPQNGGSQRPRGASHAGLQKLFGTSDDFYSVLGSENGEAVRKQLQERGDGDSMRQRIANTAFLADRFKLTAREVSDRYATLRNSYARQAFPDRLAIDGTMDDGVFFTNAGRLMQEETQGAQQMADWNAVLFDAASRGLGFSEALDEVRSSGTVPSDKRRFDIANAWMLERWEQNRATIEKLSPIVDQVTEIMAATRDKSLSPDPDTAAGRWDAAVDAMATLDDSERSIVLAQAARKAKTIPEGEADAVAKVFGTFIQGVSDLTSSAITGLYNTVDATIGHTDAEARRQARYQVERSLSQVIAGEIDPIKADSFAGQVALDFVRSVPTMLAALTPAGLAADYFALKQNAREALESQGVRGGNAEGLATVQAIPQTALFFASSKMVFLGRVPAAFGKSIPATLATEFAGNALLNEAGFLTDAGVQEVASVLNRDIPGVDWSKFAADFKGRLPQSLAMAIPGALIGTGVATFKDRASGKSYLQAPETLDVMGFPQEAKAEIVAAPDVETAQKAFQHWYDERVSMPPPAFTPPVSVEPLGKRFLVAEGVGEPVEQFQVRVGDDPRGRTLTAEQMTAEGISMPSAPMLEIARVSFTDADQFMAMMRAHPRGLTRYAYEVGRAVRSREEINALLKAEADANEQLNAAAAAKDFDRMMLLASKPQFFREAYEAAVGVGSAGEHLAKTEPEYVPPITRNADGTYRVQATPDAAPVVASSPEGAVMVQQAQNAEAIQRAATAPPEPRPEQDGRALPPRITALNKDAITALRSLFNMEELDAPTRERFVQVLDEAKRTETARTASDIAHDILATRRVSSAAEHAALVLRSAELQNLYEQKAAEIGNAFAAGDTARGDALRAVATNIATELDLITDASDLSGTEIARALSIRRMRVNRDDYTLAKLVQRASEAKRDGLTVEQRQRFEALDKELTTAREEIARQKVKLAEQDATIAKQNAETFVAEGRARRRSAAAQNASARRQVLKQELLALGMRVNDITNIIGLSVDQARIVAKIADTYIEEGVATLQELTNKLKTDIPDLSDQDIFIAVGRQTKKEAAKIENEAKRRVRELRSQAALWAKLNAALDGKRGDGSPLNRTQQNTLLKDTLAQLRRQANKTTFDDASLKRVDAKIAEIQHHLAKGTRPSAPPVGGEENAVLGKARRTLDELRQEMGARDTIAELERALTEVQPKTDAEGKTQTAPTEQQAKVNALRERLADLRDEIEQAKVDPAAVNAERQARLERLAAELEEQLEGGFRFLKPVREGVTDSETVAATRKQVRELERLMRTEDAMADLNEQIRTLDFRVSPPEQRILSNARLEAALIKQRQLRRQADEFIEELRPRTARERVVEALLVPRTLIATADLSATLRQGLLLSASRPVTAARTFVASLRSFLNENTSDAIALAIDNRPLAIEGHKAGLYLSNAGGAPSAREELFIGRFAERIPGFGRIVRASSRAMVTTLNLLRVAAFDSFVQNHPETTADQRKAYAQYVNAASGRGNVKWSPSTVKTLNAVFFAPRYAVSRFQALYSPIKNFNDPTVRNAIAKDFGALVGTGMAAMGLAALAGAEVSLDPSESDFGKIVIDDTRIDLWGGLQQPARLIAQAALLVPQKAGLVELERDIDPLDSGMKFLSYKLSPAVTVPLALASGENIIGQEQDIPETLIRSVVPLTLQEAWDVARENESVAAGAGAAVLGGLGVSVQQHERR